MIFFSSSLDNNNKNEDEDTALDGVPLLNMCRETNVLVDIPQKADETLAQHLSNIRYVYNIPYVYYILLL